MANESDFTDSIHPVVADYRKRLAARGLFDDKDDLQVVRFLAQKNPTLLEKDPTFGELYGQIREANAPSLGEEASRGFKRAGIGLGETALAAGTLATDSDYLRRKTAALGLMASDPDLAPTIPTIDEIRSGRDAIRYAASKVGEVVPSLAESLAVAGIGALAGTATAPGPGTLAGAAGGLAAKTAAKAALRKAALRGATAANAANSYALSSGEIYNETNDRGLALGLGAVAAIPDTILPTYVISKFLPDVPKELVKEEGKKFLARLATEGLKTSGIEASTESFQEAVNIVARNLKEERDPLSFSDADLVRIREAGITGAVAGGLVAPATAVGGRAPEVDVDPVAVPSAPVVPAAAPSIVTPSRAPAAMLPSQRVRAMSPEAQVARLAELQTRARAGDEEAEYQILLQAVPREAVAPVTPEVVEAVAAGNLPLAPTVVASDAGIGEAVLPEGRTPVDDLLAQPPSQNVLPTVGVPVPSVAPAAPAPAVEAPAPVAPVLPEAQSVTLQEPVVGAGSAPNLESGAEGVLTPALTPAAAQPLAAPATKQQAIAEAVSDPETRWQYTVQRPMVPGGKGFIQIDAIRAGGNTVSSNIEDLRAAGLDLPDVPDSMEQGQYSLEEVRAAQGMTPEGASRVTVLGQEPVATSAVAGGEAQGNTGPAEAVVNSPAQRIEELARQGFTALQIAARIDSTKEAVQKVAREAGIALPLKSSRKPDIVMTPIMPEESLATPRSREQALNDAGADLPPISGMSRAAKRQELDAAGITTYKGKPLDAANPAEISAAVGKLRRGELGKELPPAPRTSTEPTNPAVQAQRTKEFQAVMGRLTANGANVQVFSQELLAQQTGEVIQQQLSALQQRLAAATAAPQRNELAKQIAVREERLAEVAKMRGVTYSPYHIAIAMDDVANASLDNLVTLLHEAAESLTMRLTPAQQGSVFRAVEAATAQMNAKMQAAAKNTGATIADVPVPSELLAETMAQTLAAEGIPESASLADAIARWIKEIYYRVAMAAQRAFGGEPSPGLALDWYENQLRRELGGDYQYSLASLLDRFLPQANSNFASKFTGATGTPGGMPDFFDPVSQKVQQPWVEPTSDEALAWNMKFQTVGANPGEVDGIPADEAVARQTAASYNDQIEWLTKLHDDIAPTMDMAEFLGLVSRGEKTPHEMLEALKTAMPGVETAKIGGERMTDAMNKWAAHQTLEFMKGVQGSNLTRIAKMQEAVKEGDERFTEHATELNRLEPDVRNAELHEAELRAKARTIIEGVLKSYKNGFRTSSKLGMMIEAEENLGDRDPLPQFYAQAFANLLKADVPLFSYVEAIALLDLPVADMTPEEIWKAVRDNSDTSKPLRELAANKPLAMTVSVLAKNSARQLDQLQLRRSDADTFLDIRRELEGIRNATEAQLREMLKTIDEKNDAKGLRQRIKNAYLKERRALNRASARIAQVEERIQVLENAKPAVAQKIGDMQQAIGGVFSEWTPADGAELTVMRRGESGSFQKATRTLEFNKDGSAVDSDGILNDLAQNEQWLKANVERAGTKEYEQVKHQTRAMQIMDVQRAYQAHNYGKVIGFIDAFVRPLQAIAKQAGHSVGNRIVQQFNKYEFINRSGAKALQNQSYEWGAAMNDAMKALGIKDVGQFRSQIYNPVKFWLGVNPGLDKGQAIRGAVALARKQSPNTPAANFSEKFEAFLLKDKEIEDELLRTAENNGVLVWDAKLGELRKAIARGWSTGMRMMNDGLVATLVHDMEKSGWKLEFDQDARKESRKVVAKSVTFDALNPANATTPEERTEYYAQLDNTEVLRAAIRPYFTPGIINRWLLPFINKPGESVFSHDGTDIAQIDLQNAWAKSGGDVLAWIDNLGQMIDVAPEENASAAATFRWDMLRQLEGLFKWEAGMAYEAEQTPDLFSNQGAKLHVMMDARVNDLLPAEHVNFAMHDPTSVRQMLGQIAFHGAFGRNGAALMANLKELEAVSVAKKFAFDGLRSTTVEGRKREAKEKGFDYADLKQAVDHYHDVLELKGEIESAMGVKNIYGPLYDARGGMELLGFMVGQVVDQPKTGALNFLSIGARPFAMHSFSPKVLKATALSYGDLAKNTFGNMLKDFGVDIVRMSDYAKETGEVEGKAFRRLPYATVLSGDTGKDGSFQDSLSSRFLVQPLRILRALQKKGVGPGIASIPGLGTMQRFATEGAMANIRGQTYLLQEIINNGIRHFSAHPEDLANPAFRFNANNLKLKADRGMYDWFRNKTVEYNMGPIERIVREAIARQAAGERTITTEMVEQLSQMNAQELDGASSINTAPAGLAQNTAFRVALPLLRWPLWMMHAAHEGLADANGRLDFKSMMRGIGRLAAWNLPLGLAFTFMIDEYDEKILKKKNAMPAVSPLAAIPVAGIPLALATTPRSIPTELLGIGQRMIRSGNIYGLGADMAGALVTPFDPGSGQRAFSLDQRVLVMSQFLNLTQAISKMVSQGGTATWGSVYRPMVASIGGNGMLNSVDVVNNLIGLDNAESRLTQRINAARWVNTAAKELEIETKKASGFSNPTPMSVWTREMQLAAMANNRADFMDAYRKALDAARETVAGDEKVLPQDREKEAVARVLASWRARNPFSGLMSTPTPAQIQAMLNAMNDQGRADVRDAMRYYDAYTNLIKPSEMGQYLNRRMQAADPARQMESMRRRAAAGMMVGP